MAWRGSVVLRVVGLIAVLLVVVLLVGTGSVASRRGGPVPCPLITGPVMNGPFGMTSPLVWANPCPGNSLEFGTSNILTLDHSFKGKDQTYPIRLWQNVGTDDYQTNWRSEDVSRYTDALIGDPDGDGEREIVALAWCDVQVGKKKDKVVERRVWLEMYEPSSTGFPDFQGPDYFVIQSWDRSRRVYSGDFDASTPQDELVVLTSYQVALFSYDPATGFHLVPGSVSTPTAALMYRGDVGDVNGDGQPELVVGTTDADVYVWSWEAGTWTLEVSDPTGLPFTHRAKIGNVVGDAGLEIVGGAYDPDTRESYVLIWQYDSELKRYTLVSNWATDLEGDAILYGFDLANLDPDDYQELVYGTAGSIPNNEVGVLDFTGGEWNTLWSATNTNVANYATVGDLDGDSATIELIFAGASDGGSYYLEVYTWSGGAASSSWSSIGEFGQAGALGLG